jgi:hypothetical protein
MPPQLIRVENPCQLIEKYGKEPYCLELLQFFGWHPNTRFSRLAILHALAATNERRFLDIALRRLVDKGIVTTYSENNVPFYCLTEDLSLRQEALDAACIDWSQWQDMLRQGYNYLLTFITSPEVTNA